MKQSRHIIEKRRNDIVELLHQSGQQQVQTLSEYFHTSPLTIRRDLIELEKQGIIERTYGGACLKKTLSLCMILQTNRPFITVKRN